MFDFSILQQSRATATAGYPAVEILASMYDANNGRACNSRETNNSREANSSRKANNSRDAMYVRNTSRRREINSSGEGSISRDFSHSRESRVKTTVVRKHQ
jgi:hypothetical protein